MKKIKELTEEEVGLLNEMKDRCLNKGLYVDVNAEKKFKMLCHLEDFNIQYYELLNNWNELKDILKELKRNRYYDNDVERFTAYEKVLNTMQELESRK